MELCLVLSGSLDRRGFGGEWTHVYVWLSPFALHLKLSQHSRLIGYTPIQNKKLKNSSVFYIIRQGAMIGCDKVLCVRILCSRSCTCQPGHNTPINLREDKYSSLFCNFLSLYEWEIVIPLKAKALRRAILYISGYYATFVIYSKSNRIQRPK